METHVSSRQTRNDFFFSEDVYSPGTSATARRLSRVLAFSSFSRSSPSASSSQTRNFSFSADSETSQLITNTCLPGGSINRPPCTSRCERPASCPRTPLYVCSRQPPSLSRAFLTIIHNVHSIDPGREVALWYRGCPGRLRARSVRQSANGEQLLMLDSQVTSTCSPCGLTPPSMVTQTPWSRRTRFRCRSRPPTRLPTTSTVSATRLRRPPSSRLAMRMQLLKRTASSR